MRLLRIVLGVAITVLIALAGQAQKSSLAQARSVGTAQGRHDYPVQPVPFTAVRLNDGGVRAEIAPRARVRAQRGWP